MLSSQIPADLIILVVVMARSGVMLICQQKLEKFGVYPSMEAGAETAIGKLIVILSCVKIR